MNQEITIQLQCVVLNGQVEKWLEKERAEIIREAVKRGDKFVEINGELMNTSAVVGIFNAQTMAEKIRRRNGEWQCEHGNWWAKMDSKCECRSKEEKERRDKISSEIKTSLAEEETKIANSTLSPEERQKRVDEIRQNLNGKMNL